MSLSAARSGVRTPDLRALAAELRPLPLIVGGLTVAAFVVYLSQIHQSLFADEVITYHEVARHSLPGVIHAVGTGGDLCPPLFFVLAWMSAKLGDPTVWIRLPSMILGAGTIPVVYLLGREAIGRAAGAIGATAFALSPFALFYGVQARPYAAAAFFTVLSTYALVRAVRSDERRWWVLYAAAAAAAAYSHYTTVFVLVVQGVWGLWACRTRLRRPLIANVAAAVMFMPWLAYLHGGAALNEFALTESLTPSHVLQDLVRVLFGYPSVPLHAIPTVPGFAAIAACALIGSPWFVRRYLGDRAQIAYDAAHGGALLLVALAIATPIGALLYSVVGTDIWHVESAYASAPAAMLVLGALLAAIPRRPRVVAVAVVLGALLVGTIRGLSPSWIRPQYRAVAHYLDRVAKPRDPVLLFTYSYILDDAIPAQLKRPHAVFEGVPRHWPRRPAGTLAFVVVDKAELHRLRHRLAPHGYLLLARRQYPGLVPFTLFTYRAV